MSGGYNMKKLIVLLTDFGLQDPYVGVMKGVIKNINPDAEIIDLTHMVERQNVYQAAVILYVSAHYFPRGTIFVCVVDPGVGSKRRALLITTRNFYLIGPDNGCLSLLAEKDGVVKVYDISDSPYRLGRISYTFHGRDIFAPVAAWLSLGIKPEQLGVETSYESIVKYKLREPVVTKEGIIVEVVYIDVFVNVMTNINDELLVKQGLMHGKDLRVHVKDNIINCKLVPSFSHVPRGEYACYINSWGFFEIGLNHGKAAEKLNVRIGDSVKITS